MLIIHKAVPPLTIFLSFLYGIILLNLLSYTCLFFHGFFLGFILPLQALAALVSEYHIQGFDQGWERTGFVLGILGLIYSIKKRGIIIYTKKITVDGATYIERII